MGNLVDKLREKQTAWGVFIILGLLIGVMITISLALIAGILIWQALFPTVTSACSGLTDYVYLDTLTRIEEGKMQSDCSDILVVDGYGSTIPSCISDCGSYESKLWFNATGDEVSLFYGIYCYDSNTSSGQTTTWCDLGFKKVYRARSSTGEGLGPLESVAGAASAENLENETYVAGEEQIRGK